MGSSSRKRLELDQTLYYLRQGIGPPVDVRERVLKNFVESVVLLWTGGGRLGVFIVAGWERWGPVCPNWGGEKVGERILY